MGKACHWSEKQGRIDMEVSDFNMQFYLHSLSDGIIIHNSTSLLFMARMFTTRDGKIRSDVTGME